SRRPRPHAADRVQLRLAVSAVVLGATDRGAAHARQGRRGPPDRGPLRPRLLFVGRGAPDTNNSGVSRAPRRPRPSASLGVARWKMLAAPNNLARSDSTRVRYTPDSGRTRTPARAPCRS